MPFDGTTAKQIRRPKCDPTAAQSALVLDMVELFFRDGAKWAHGRWKTPDGKRCLIGAVRFVRRQIGSNADRAPNLSRARDFLRKTDRSGCWMPSMRLLASMTRRAAPIPRSRP
jgi:hypothetical protein